LRAVLTSAASRGMASLQRKPLDQPDETRPIDKGTVEEVELEGGTVMRTTFEPGWRWSECLKPAVGGDSCQVDHFGYCSHRTTGSRDGR
jgi:hypothetical protein